MPNDLFDITIIGAGPVGLFAAFYAGLRNCKIKIIDSLEHIGGQPRYLYPEKFIFDIPAYEKINGYQLAQNLQKQLQRFPVTYCMGEEVLSIDFDEENHIFSLITDQQHHLSKSIIIAAGNGAFAPKKIELPNADILEGKQLHYYVDHLETFKDSIVMVCGGGDSALDWALMLENIAEKVYLVHRRDKFRAIEHTVSNVKKSSVEIITPYIPSQFHLDTTLGRLNKVSFTKVKSTETITLDVDHVLVNYGFSSSMTTIRNWGLKMERNGIRVDAQYQTSHKGIFAIGDIAIYPGKLNLIATGFGEAPQAVQNALNFIYPDQRFAPIHSSDLLS